MSPLAPFINPDQGQKLLRLARRSLVAYYRLEEGRVEDPPVEPAGPIGGLFASLHRGSELRGCIGFLSPEVDLMTLVERAVIAAAVEDPRFPRVLESDLETLRITISVLSPPVLLEAASELRVGRDGLIVEREGARGLLLPQVARERGWDPERFLAETCRKAGLPPDAFRDPRTRILRFESLEFSESSP